MSVKIRPYGKGGWEVDIRLRLPDGSVVRERTKSPVAGKTATMRWAQAREHALLVRGTPKAQTQEVKTIVTLKDFAPRFLEGYAKANRQKPSGIVATESILNTHLIPRFGGQTLDAISTEDVQRLKSGLSDRAPKTVNNVLAVLNTLLKAAVEWKVIDRMPCAIRLLKVAKASMGFYDVEEYGRLRDAAATLSRTTSLIVLLGGDAGLRCGEMIALEWGDVDLVKRQLTVQRSAWRGHVTAPKGGRARYVPLTRRLVDALREHRHLRSARVLGPSDGDGSPLTWDVAREHVQRAVRRARITGSGTSGIHRLRHTFCSHLAMRGAPARAIQELAGHQDLGTTQRYMHLSPAALDGAIRLLEASDLGSARGEIVETDDREIANVNTV
ncbi:MAG TPA: site-specific integrase [Vicinamibacterales bacterium]|nr:site-specific integrase [Vicinamibacterales bacterium]